MSSISTPLPAGQPPLQSPRQPSLHVVLTFMLRVGFPRVGQVQHVPVRRLVKLCHANLSFTWHFSHSALVLVSKLLSDRHF